MMPKVFIGSSFEGLPIANAIHENLDYDAEVNVWNQGIFELSATIFSELERILKNFHFAIFVFTPDDVIFTRKKQAVTARDNIIFETGLFIGRLGSTKVYMLKPRGIELKLPSDLAGVTFGTYNPDRTDLRSSVAPFCNEVRGMINKYFSRGLSPLNNDNIIENNIHYDIKILNSQGDSKLILTHSITPINHPMASRKHEIFSDNGSMESRDMNLTAWDGKKNELLLEVDKDYPNRKHFKIHFKDSLEKNKTFEYSFSFDWKQMFPSKEEYFKLKKIDGKSSFCLCYPKSWNMLFLKAEYNAESENTEPIVLIKKKPKLIGDFKVEECFLKDADSNSAITISWNRK